MIRRLWTILTGHRAAVDAAIARHPAGKGAGR